MDNSVLTSGRGSHYWLSWSSHMLHMWIALTPESSPFQLGLSSFQTSHSDDNNLFRTSAPCLQLNHRNSEELNCVTRNLSQSRYRVLNIQEKILQTLKLDERVGFQCLGQSNWTNCSLLSHFCLGIFPTFSLSYWEANFYYPRGPIMGKGILPTLLNGTQMVQFECSKHWIPSVSSSFEVGWIPFSHYWPLG